MREFGVAMESPDRGEIAENESPGGAKIRD